MKKLVKIKLKNQKQRLNKCEQSQNHFKFYFTEYSSFIYKYTIYLLISQFTTVEYMNTQDNAVYSSEAASALTQQLRDVDGADDKQVAQIVDQLDQQIQRLTEMNRNLEIELASYIKQQKGEIQAVTGMVERLKKDRKALLAPQERAVESVPATKKALKASQPKQLQSQKYLQPSPSKALNASTTSAGKKRTRQSSVSAAKPARASTASVVVAPKQKVTPTPTTLQAAPSKQRKLEAVTPSKALTPNRYGNTKSKTPKRIGAAPFSQAPQLSSFLARDGSTSIEYGLLNPVLLRSRNPQTSQASRPSTPRSKQGSGAAEVNSAHSKGEQSPERGAKTRVKIQDQTAVIADLKLQIETLEQEFQTEYEAIRPQIEIARSQFNCVSKDDLTELKHLSSPPQCVKYVMDLILLAFGCKQQWSEAQKLLANPGQFIKELNNYDFDGISQSLFSKVLKSTQNDSFTMDKVKNTSIAACGLFMWINSFLNYYNVAQNPILIKSKIEKKQEQLAIEISSLHKHERKLNRIAKKSPKKSAEQTSSQFQSPQRNEVSGLALENEGGNQQKEMDLDVKVGTPTNAEMVEEVEKQRAKIMEIHQSIKQLGVKAAEEREKVLPQILQIIPGFKGITAKDLDELKRLNSPPEVIINVLSAFFSVFNKNKLNWDSIRIEMKCPSDVIRMASDLDIDNLPEEVLLKFQNYDLDEWITEDCVKSKSLALVGIYNWLKTLVNYIHVNKEVLQVRIEHNKQDSRMQRELKVLTKLEKKAGMMHNSSFLDELDAPAGRQVDDDVVNIVLDGADAGAADDLKLSLASRKCLHDCEATAADDDHACLEVVVMSDKAIAIKHALEDLDNDLNQIIVESQPKLKEAAEVATRLKEQNFDDIAQNAAEAEPKRETEAVLEAIMAAFEIDDLEAVKKELADPDFANKLAAYNISEMKKQAFKQLDKLTKSATYKDKSILQKFSEKAQDVCKWVVSITDCFQINQKIEDVNKLKEKKEEELKAEFKRTGYVEEKVEGLPEDEVQIRELKDALQELTAQYADNLKSRGPTLEEAQAAIRNLPQICIDMIQQYEGRSEEFSVDLVQSNAPPPGVEVTMYALMSVLGKETTWSIVKETLADDELIFSLLDFTVDEMSVELFQKLDSYTSRKAFNPAVIEKQSLAAGAFAKWLRAIKRGYELKRAIKLLTRQQSLEKNKVLARMENHLADEFEKHLSAVEQKQGTQEQNKQNLRQELKAVIAGLQADTDSFTAALAAAQAALSKVTKKELGEVRNLRNPHKDVQSVVAAVMTVLKKDKKWDAAVKQMQQPDQFLQRLQEVKPDQLSKGLENKLLEYTKQSYFKTNLICQKSKGASSLCAWCLTLKEVIELQRKVEVAKQHQQELEVELNGETEEASKISKPLEQPQNAADETFGKQHEEAKKEEGKQTSAEAKDDVVERDVKEEEKESTSVDQEGAEASPAADIGDGAGNSNENVQKMEEKPALRESETAAGVLDKLKSRYVEDEDSEGLANNSKGSAGGAEEKNKEASVIEDLRANIPRLVAHSQAETKKAEAELAKASENIKNITTAELQAITSSNNRKQNKSGSQKSPESLSKNPQVTQVFFGLMILLGREQAWTQVKQELAKADFVQVLLASEPKSGELLSDLAKHIAQNQVTFVDQGLSKLNAATASVRDWLMAMNGKYEAKKAAAKIETITAQAEPHIKDQSEQSAGVAGSKATGLEASTSATEAAQINLQILELLDDAQGGKKRRSRQARGGSEEVKKE